MGNFGQRSIRATGCSWGARRRSLHSWPTALPTTCQKSNNSLWYPSLYTSSGATVYRSTVQHQSLQFTVIVVTKHLRACKLPAINYWAIKFNWKRVIELEFTRYDEQLMNWERKYQPRLIHSRAAAEAGACRLCTPPSLRRWCSSEPRLKELRTPGTAPRQTPRNN